MDDVEHSGCFRRRWRRSRLIDACKERRLSDLVKLYDDSATVDCQGEGRFKGRTALRRYLRAKLQNQKPGAFAIDALVPEAAGVCLDYRDCDGRAVRTHSRLFRREKSPTPPRFQ